MKRILFISLLIFSLASNSQVRSFGDNIYGFKSKAISFTFKPMLNTNYMSDLIDRFDDGSSSELAMESSEAEFDMGSIGDDLLNLGSYDVRVRLSLGKNVSFVNQVIINGDSFDGYRYTSGIIITF